MKRTPLLLTLACATACGAQTSGDDPASAPEPGALPGGDADKADVASRVAMRGALAYGTPANGRFVEDLQFEGYTLGVRAGARFTVEVTQAGTSRALDSVLFVYGPKGPSGYGTAAIARDDDSGWGPHPRLKNFVVPTTGEYLVVLGTRDGQGRGAYRLSATCAAGDCAPPAVAWPEVCPERLATGLLACAGAQLAAPGLDAPPVDRPTPEQAVETCLDAEGLAGPWDAYCAASAAPACTADFEQVFTAVAPLCRAALMPVARREVCAFGDTWRGLGHVAGLAVTGQRTARQVDHMPGIIGEQVVAAMVAAGHTDVRTPAQALERADGNEIHLVDLWHEGAGQAYLGVEFGAGDTSVGAVLPRGGKSIAVRNGDGDFYDCAVARGPRGADCTQTADCTAGLTCQGKSDASGLGKCVDQHARAGAGDPCSLSRGCAGDGVICAGLMRAPQGGLCVPAWMQSTFRPEPGAKLTSEPGTASLTLPIDVRGLATVDLDVQLDLQVTPRGPTGLVVRLVHASGASVTVHEGRHGEEGLWLSNPVFGFSGDEYVNGAWSLVLEDRDAVGLTVDDVALTIASRWD